MMKKSYVCALAFLTCFSFIGCGNAANAQGNTAPEAQTVKEETPEAATQSKDDAQNYAALKEGDDMDKAVFDFQTLMDKDVYGDKKAVFWDGTKAYEDTDEQDSKDILDGRSARGFEALEKELWKTNIYGMEDRNEIFNEDDHVLFTGENYRFEVELIDSFEERFEKLQNEKWLTLLDDRSEGEGASRTALFRGVREYDGKYYAGYVVCFFDGYGNNYEYSYMYIGNMNEAGTMINQIKNQFAINFDLQEWLKEHYPEIGEVNGNG